MPLLSAGAPCLYTGFTWLPTIPKTVLWCSSQTNIFERQLSLTLISFKKNNTEIEDKVKAPGGGIVCVPTLLEKDTSSSLSSAVRNLSTEEEAVHHNQVTVVRNYTVYSWHVFYSSGVSDFGVKQCTLPRWSWKPSHALPDVLGRSSQTKPGNKAAAVAVLRIDTSSWQRCLLPSVVSRCPNEVTQTRGMPQIPQVTIVALPPGHSSTWGSAGPSCHPNLNSLHLSGGCW